MNPGSVRVGLAAVLAGTLLAATANGQFGGGMGGGLTVPQLRDIYEVVIEYYDTDANSRLDQREFLVLPQGLFAKLDGNGDGMLDEGEFATMGEAAAAHVRLVGARVFDANGDGSLQAKEFRKLVSPVGLWGPQTLEHVFIAGALPVEEKPSWKDDFRLLDEDGDGEVEVTEGMLEAMDEARKKKSFALLLKALLGEEAVEEGAETLPREDFLKLWEMRFGGLDADKDGALSAVELYSLQGLDRMPRGKSRRGRRR